LARSGSAELEEEAEEEKPPAPWRHEEAGSYKDTGTTSGAKDWRAGSFEQILAKKIPVDSWTPVEDKPELVETAPAASNVVKETQQHQPLSQKTSPVTGTIAAAPFGNDAWAAARSPVSPERFRRTPRRRWKKVARVKQSEPSSPAAVVANVPEVKQAEPPKTPKDSWFSVPSNPWNAEMRRPTTGIGVGCSGSVGTPPSGSNGTEKAAEAVSETTQLVIEEAALPAGAVEAIREEAAQVAEDATQSAEQHADDGRSFYAPEALIEPPWRPLRQPRAWTTWLPECSRG